MATIAMIVAGGKGIRFGGQIPKQFQTIIGRPLLSWTIRQFEEARTIDEIVVVVPEDFLLYTRENVVNPYSYKKVTHIVVGGKTRQESVKNGLSRIPISTEYVAIHDGARPVVLSSDIDRVVETARKERAAILARKVTDTVKRIEMDYIISTLDRDRLVRSETPQAFQYDIITAAHEKTTAVDLAPDDAYLVEAQGFKVKAVLAEGPNIKVTNESDFEIAGFLLRSRYESDN
jgi:2-C-methyl-D-erythritol 4-phosphate cytidylyltransferase